MTSEPRLSVVVAVEESAANLPAILGRLDPAAHAECEFIFCAADPAELALLPSALAHVRMLRCAHGSRIPQMWRDGIVAARSGSVALLSAHVVPSDRWLPGLLARPLEVGEAGRGGWFSNDPAARAHDWAIYLLRYAAFSRPVARAAVTHIAADNAVYRRSEILACEDLLARGFWETEYHVRFLAKGLRLALSDELEVVHVNRYGARSFAAQRREHGFAFGRDRAQRFGAAALVLHLTAAPLVPLLLLGKVLVRSHRQGWTSVVPVTAYAWLLWFVAHWAWGEVSGVTHQFFRRMRCLPWPSRRRPSR